MNKSKLNIWEFFSTRSKSITIFVLMLLSLVPLIIAAWNPLLLNDDALITLTYAKNLARGNGFVYNHSPAVLGTTTPLLALSVALFAWLMPTLSLPAVAVFVTAFCWIGLFWIFLAFRTSWGLDDWHVCVIAFVLLSTGWVGQLGMEAYLFAFLLTLCLSLNLVKKYFWTGFSVGLLFLTRGEGGLLLVVIAILQFPRLLGEKKISLLKLVQNWCRLIIGFAVPALAWTVYAYGTFGAVLPNTLAAKRAQGNSGLGNSFAYRLINEWIPNWRTSFSFDELPALNFWWAIVVVGLLLVVIQKRQFLAFVLWIALYASALGILNVSGAWWYQLPILFVMDLLFALGLIGLTGWVRRVTSSRFIAAGILSILLLSVLMLLAKPTMTYAWNFKGDSRGPGYIELSQWFQENTEPEDSIAYIEIGYLGFYTENKIVDLFGLVLPDVVPYIENGDMAWSFWHYEPDYYIYNEGFDFYLEEIVQDQRFAKMYQPVITLSEPGETLIMIYKRFEELNSP